MGYSDTGYNECTTSLDSTITSVTSTASVTPVHTITIFSVTGKKDFNFINDFVNVFTETELEDIFDDPLEFSTEYSGTNKDGDEIYFDIDGSTSFTHTLTEDQDNTNEKTTVILVVNPLIKKLHNPYFETNIYIEEVPTTQTLTLTKDGSNVTDVELEHSYLQSTYTAFSKFNASTDFIKKAEYFIRDNSRADVLIDENWKLKPNGDYALVGDFITLNISLERNKHGLQRYYDTGEFIELPFGLNKYSATVPTKPDSDIYFFKNESFQTITFDISSYKPITDGFQRILLNYIFLYSGYLCNIINPTFGYSPSTVVYIYLQGAIPLDIRSSPEIVFCQVDPSNPKIINVIVKNAVSGLTYTVTPIGKYPFLPGTSTYGYNGALLDDDISVTI